MRKGGGCFCWGRQLGLSHRARKQHTNNTQNNTQNNTHTHLCFCFYLYSQRGVWCLLRFYKNDSVGPFCQFFADTAKIQHKKLLCTKITKPQKKKKKKKKTAKKKSERWSSASCGIECMFCAGFLADFVLLPLTDRQTPTPLELPIALIGR